MAEVTKITLEKNSDISKVEKLHEQLEALLDAANGVDIDASAVERIDTCSLQVLVSFINTMSKLHLDARLVTPSNYFVDTARLMGLSEHLNLNH